ncbi:hypothetical protein FACS1894216_01360 [Synergistales bacterium]|nr:hypothetical protein FACS1894216_01360 [Synergistales bacterium]
MELNWNGISRAYPNKRAKHEIELDALAHREETARKLIAEEENKALRAMRAVILNGAENVPDDVTRLAAAEEKIAGARAELAAIANEREGIAIPAPGEPATMAAVIR